MLNNDVNFSVNNNNTCNSLSLIDKEIELWHNRLGHICDNVLNHLSFIKKGNKNKVHICEVCPLAKQQGLSFPISKSKTKNAFELVHIDTWGPYNQGSLSGAYYLLTLVDGCTRATCTCLLTKPK